MGTGVRVGLIGVGWGSAVQVPAFRMVPEYEVAAICSRRPDRVSEAGAALGIPDVSTDWEAFVRRDDLDLISVCTPVGLHAAMTLAAIEHGKHVLVEKPQALVADDAKRMYERAEAAGVAHAVCFEGRYEDQRVAVRQLVHDGYLGHAYFAQAHALADYWHPSRGLQSEWMYRVDQGGGYLMGMASHEIDFLSHLFGVPEAVCADVRTSVPLRRRRDGSELVVDADDTSVLVLRLPGGTLATIITSAVGLLHGDRGLDLLGSDGTIRVEGAIQGGEPVVRAARVGDSDWHEVGLGHRAPRSGIPLPERRAAGAIRALALMLEDWLPAFDGKPAPGVPTLGDGWRVQQVIDAARRSSASEGWVSL